MKRLSLLVLLVLAAPAAGAEVFLEAPVMPQGRAVSQTESRMEKSYPLKYGQVLEFYRQVLKDQADVKFRDWKDEVYIEDQGRRPWHSIRISKEGRNETVVTITRDSWTWILGMLALRFTAVFGVLLVLYLAMKLAATLIARFAQETPVKAA